VIRTCLGPAAGFLLLAWCLTSSAIATGKTLQVGPGKKFERIEKAVKRAKPGDIIEVYPRLLGQAYEGVGVSINKPRVTIRAVGVESGIRVKVSGDGYSHSGRGSTPRAIFQFNPRAEGSVLEGFEITGASNSGNNGAGVRINQANNITIRNCYIHHNQMGIMSNGKVELKNAVNQVIEHSAIHHNLRHNLYLSGTSVTLRFSEVHNPIELHNIKSRAHFTRVAYSYIHDSANRELDLVDSPLTALPGSHAVLLGNIIAKDPNTRGNLSVIHFGQDNNSPHVGTLFLIHNTVITPFSSPVIDLSSKEARAVLIGNIFDDGGGATRRNHQVLGSSRRGGASTGKISGWDNWFAPGFTSGLDNTSIDKSMNTFAARSSRLYVDPLQHDYRLQSSWPGIGGAGRRIDKLQIPLTPGALKIGEPLSWQYAHPSGRYPRTAAEAPDLGAQAVAGP